jgi:hypothetical protein
MFKGGNNQAVWAGIIYLPFFMYRLLPRPNADLNN